MGLTKTIARELVFPFLHMFNAEKILSGVSKNSHLSLTFHGVVQNNEMDFSRRHFGVHEFEALLDYLEKHFEIISLKEAFSRRENIQSTKTKRNSKSVSLSFDDGFLNNYTYALPIIAKRNLPCTFFISTVLFGDMKVRALVPEILECLRYFHFNDEIRIGELKFVQFYSSELQMGLIEYLKSLESNNRDRIVSHLIDAYLLEEKFNSIPEEFWKLMEREDFVKLAQSDLVEIGSHGHLHYTLANQSEEVVRSELVNSKSCLEEVLKRKVDMFAYPYGSYSEKTIRLCEEVGYAYQLVVEYNSMEDQNDSRIMNRYTVPTSTNLVSNYFHIHNNFRKNGH